MSVLEFDLQKRFERLQLSLTTKLSQGKIIAILGPSGSGKSTLLRMLAGLETPDQGRIQFGQNVWFDSSQQTNQKPQLRHVGMVFQDYALFEHMTVEGNVGFGVEKHQREARCRLWLERLQLSDYASAYPSALSGGQRQRVALARALATEPQLLLLDEPLSAIDFSLRRDIRRQLKNTLREWNRTSIIVTHDLEEARCLADEILVLDEGLLLQQGEIETVFENPNSVRSSQILGWQNQLAVNEVQSGVANGQWGSIHLAAEDMNSSGGTLVFRETDVRLAQDSEEGVSAKILASIPFPLGIRLELGLENNVRIEALVAKEQQTLSADNEPVRIKLANWHYFPIQ